MSSTSPSPVPPVRRGPGVVACAFYRDGQRVRVVAVEEIGGHAGHEGGIVRLGLHEPDEALLSTIQAELGLHELIVEDANQAHQRAKLNPYAGGDVRNFVRPNMAERVFGVHRPITIEARLYLNGEYQILVEKQAVIQGGLDDPDLAAAVAHYPE